MSRSSSSSSRNRLEIELEHAIGFQGKTAQCISALPHDRSRFLYTIGSVIVNASLEDPHDQRFLYGHDASACCLTPSTSGRLLASGQLECTSKPGHGSPVLIWDLATGKTVHVFGGHTHGVLAIGWSPDDRFVASSAQDGRLCIWDVATGACVGGHRPSADLAGCTFVSWLPVNLGTERRPIYKFVAGYPNQVRVYTWGFDVKSSQFVLSSQSCSVPGAGTGPGLVRTYPCSTTDASGQFALCGTTVGELVVYSTTHALYRVAVPVCSNGLLSIAVLNPAVNTQTIPMNGAPPSIMVFVGGGDGSLKRLRGMDQQWEITGQVRLGSRVTAIALLPSQQGLGDEMLVSTDDGHIYRVSCADVNFFTEVLQGHSAAIHSLSYDVSHSDILASGSADGTVRVWDLNTYKPICEVRVPAAPGTASLFPTAVSMFVSPEERRTVDRSGAPSFPQAPVSTFSSELAIVSGWSDGGIRCHAVRSGRMMWQINQAHRGRISSVVSIPLEESLDASNAMVVTAGAEDGHMRIWNCRTRELVSQWGEHPKGCSGLTLDVRNHQKNMMRPGQVSSRMFLYSVGASDKTLVSIDLRKPQRREKTHSFPEAALICVAQRRKEDYEVLCGTSDGRVVVFDEDVADRPVRVLQAIPTASTRQTGPTQSIVQQSEKQAVAAVALRCCVVSPSGKFVATAGDDAVLRVWNSDLTACLSEGICHSLPILSVSWSPDEKQIVTGGADGALCVWNAYENA
eukprot:ANDGO_03899.mRNA.1 Cilia- and flagella-associated protein 52